MVRHYGGLLGEQLPQAPTIPNAPRVLSGEPNFQNDTTSRSLYNLSDGVYDQLVGQEEQNRRTGARNLAQYYEERTRANRNLF